MRTRYRTPSLPSRFSIVAIVEHSCRGVPRMSHGWQQRSLAVYLKSLTWCPGPDSNRHDAFRHRWILSPLCLPVSPPGQGDHCSGGAWIRAVTRSNRSGGNDLSTPPRGRRYRNSRLPPSRRARGGSFLPKLGTLVSSAGAVAPASAPTLGSLYVTDEPKRSLWVW